MSFPVQVVVEAEAVVVFLDQAYRPVRIPADVKQIFSQVCSDGSAAPSPQR